MIRQPLSRLVSPLKRSILMNIKFVTSRHHGDLAAGLDKSNVVTIHWLLQDGKAKRTTQAIVGQNLLQVAHSNDIDLEGACEGVCACSTCHTIIEDALFNTLDEASEDEEDMLDMAFGLEETSRLGCQVIVTEAFDDVVFKLPGATRNFYVDGHVPKPH